MKKIKLVAINAKYIHSNLAVYSLKKYAGEEKNIEICEYTINNRYEEIIEEIFLKKPDVLAFSCYIWNITYVKTIISEIKKILPDCIIWVGGPEVSYDSDKFLNENPNVDMVMRGEGEITFKEVVDNIDKGYEKEQLKEIKGITYRTNTGEIISNPDREYMDMSLIPFPYENMSDFENKIIYYETSRGCPFSCSYCLSSVEKRLRFRNIELVKKELKFFIDNEVPQVKFVDRTFNCNKKHSMEIWRFIRENDRGMTNFHFEIAADLIGEEELELFKTLRPGLIQLEIGVQSTNPETINEINRVMELSRLEYVVSEINKNKNIHQHLDLIAGLPFETYEIFKKSFNDVYKMKPEQLQLGFLKVLKGAGIFLNKDQYDIKYSDFPPYEVFSTDWISFEDILKLKSVEEMVEIYYNSGQFVYTMKFLLDFFESPFEMYSEMGKYYSKNFKKSMKHARIDRYNILCKFIQETGLGDKNIEILKEVMNFDIYLRENMKTRPGFAPETAMYKKEFKNIYDENGLTRLEHIDILSREAIYFLTQAGFLFSGSDDICDINYIIFDYKERDPLDHNGKVIKVRS